MPSPLSPIVSDALPPVCSLPFSILSGASQPELIRKEILADLLEATAQLYPNNTALIFQEKSLSYYELNMQADYVASWLIASGVGAGDIVGLWLPRGIDLLVMQAGIAKSGAAWLPFDADTPIDRIETCLTDAKAVGLISNLSPSLPVFPHRIWDAKQLREPTELQKRQEVDPSHPAYVIYTSGSTGKPKGIEISQGSICHFLRSENTVLGIRPSDRVYQGFSVAFDMSFEEIWISYLVGATLWIASKDIATDPEVLPSVLLENNITVLHAVPTLLALFNQDIDSLRIINLGGEMCPESLVNRWAGEGRTLFNTYGPTEATVSASLAELQPHKAVTIGKPLPNYGMVIIETTVEQGLTLQTRGNVGELCLTGPGIAKGYLGRPELTTEKFIDNPWSTSSYDTRLYRTGDLARITEEGEVQCLGRTDDQVKIRGFRVELGEIEAVLAQQPGIGTVAVSLRQEDGIDLLIAFIVPESVQTTPTVALLRAALLDCLPAYMIPGAFEFLNEMPRLLSGKIDRKALKALPLSIPDTTDETFDIPQTPEEEALFSIVKGLFPGQPLRREVDFFYDLGGHSLIAARLASALRHDARFTHITVRDIYTHRTLGKIADVLAQTSQTPSNQNADWQTPPRFKRWVCGLAQGAAIPLLVGLHMMQWLAPFFAYHYHTGEPGDSILKATFLSVWVFLLATLLQFGAAIAAKWLFIGRLKPGRYPLWGITYYRWWLVDRLVEAAPVYLLSGSSLYNIWLRALGAKIGNEVIVGSITARAHDLITIEDGSSIGSGVNFENVRVERGELHVGSIHLSKNSCIGSYSLLEGNTRVEAFGHLEGLSALKDGNTLPENQVWIGSPARFSHFFDHSSLPARLPVKRVRLLLESLFFVAGILLVSTLFFMPVFPSFILIDWLDEKLNFHWLQGNTPALQIIKYFILSFPATGLLILFTALFSAALRWSLLPRLQPGSWPIHSRVYCSKWIVNQIQESSLSVLHGVYATVFAPFWYRLLGAKIGRDAEISTALGVVPDMLTLGDETFIADAVLLGDEHIDGGWITMQPTVISHRSFVGNRAYIPDGTILPSNVLIGVSSRAPENHLIHEGDTWLGSPPLHLPSREQSYGFSETLTFRPSPLRRLSRALVETFRIIAPHAIVIAVGYVIVLDVMPFAAAGQWQKVIFYLTLAGLLYGLGTFIFVALLKWVLIGRYKTCNIPMWTSFVWLSEGVTNLYEGIAVPNFMNYLRGTPWLPLAFNVLGCKIGRGVYMDTTDITEFDCVTIGDHSEINALSCPQTHLFEDRIMKIDHIQIGNRVYMGPRTTVLYGAIIEDNSKLGSLTLVMKGEFIPANSSWSGCPAAPEQ
ncbi:MAG: Pls/PosA family non-ribosomal peptide synthetase [Pseudomonadota bacterium]